MLLEVRLAAADLPDEHGRFRRLAARMGDGDRILVDVAGIVSAEQGTTTACGAMEAPFPHP